MPENLYIQALLDKKYADWSNFVLHNTIPKDVDPIIVESWKTCKEMGINPEMLKMELVDRSLWERKLEDNTELIRVAMPIMEKFYQMLPDNQSTFLLHDKDGCVLEYLRPQNYVYRYEGKQSIKGLIITDQLSGTNSVGLCLKHDRAVQVTGAEHYNRNNIQVTCYTAPIHDDKGKVIGCVNLVGKAELTNPSSLGMMSMTAVAIETQFALVRASNLVNRSIDVMSEAAVVLDETCEIVRFNKKFVELFQIKNEQLLYGFKFTEVFQEERVNRKILKQHRPCDVLEMLITVQGIKRNCNLSLSPIMAYNRLVGVIILLRPTKELALLANKMVGNRSFYTFEDIVTQNVQLKNTIEIAKKIADTDCTILIQSESGTGKEMFAQAIHNYSKRQKQPIVVVNCAALPSNLVESELFGYEKGAFSGADDNGRPGKFELANGGTIFLDEVGELPLEIQPKLLRVLDSCRVTRLGGNTEIELDVRIITATNRDLEKEVRENSFREDLYYRINVIKLNIVPLRKRLDDIELLSSLFLKRLTAEDPTMEKSMTAGFLSRMKQHHWAGNVRELQNVISKAYYMSSSEMIDETIFDYIYPPKADLREMETITGETMKEEMENTCFSPVELQERQLIKQMLKKYPKQIELAYESLGMSRSTFYRRLVKYKLKP